MGSIIIILDNNNNPPPTHVGNISQGGDRPLIMRPSHACRGDEEERYSTEEFNRRIQRSLSRSWKKKKKVKVWELVKADTNV